MTMHDQHSPLPTDPSHRVALTLDFDRPWSIAVWALFIFLMGGVSGASMLHLLQPDPPHPDPAGDDNRAFHQEVARRMQHEYRLTDQQTEAIRRIVEKYEPRFVEINHFAREALEADMETMNQEILPLLDEEQRQQHLTNWRHVIRPHADKPHPRHRPPPHRRPPHRRPTHLRLPGGW